MQSKNKTVYFCDNASQVSAVVAVFRDWTAAHNAAQSLFVSVPAIASSELRILEKSRKVSLKSLLSQINYF